MKTILMHIILNSDELGFARFTSEWNIREREEKLYTATLAANYERANRLPPVVLTSTVNLKKA
jgi:hypothetical protein